MAMRNPVPLLIGVVLLLSAGLYWAGISPAGFGSYHDDGIYLVCAKSLATGQGYRILSLPSAPWQTKYPPLYPLMLSALWRLRPDFPDNLWVMMLASAVLTLAFCWVTFRYLTTAGYASPWMALGIVVLTAANWRMLTIATGLYSEILFALLSVVILYRLERPAADHPPIRSGLLTGLLLGALILTRTAGITLLIATGLYMAWRRRRRCLLWTMAPAGLMVLLWTIWCRQHTVDAAGATADYLQWYTNYAADFRHLVPNATTFLRVVGKNFLSFLLLVPMTVFNLTLAQAVESLFFQGVVVLGALLMGVGWARDIRSGFRPLALYVAIYMGVHCAYPYRIDRYFLPLLPFLLLYLFRGLQPLARLVRSEAWRPWPLALARGFSALVLLSLLSTLWVYPYNLTLFFRNRSITRTLARNREDVASWIRRQTRPSDVLMCYQDPVYYLLTGRKALRSLIHDRVRVMQFYNGGEPTRPASIGLLAVLREMGGSYLILSRTDFSLEGRPDLLRNDLETLVVGAPEIFTPAYQSENGAERIYRIAPLP